MKFFVIYLIIINIAAFVLFWADKRKARKKQWRIPEKTLFLSAFLGGSPGAIAGMLCFHHKTKHWYFRIGLPGIFLLQVIVLAGMYLYMYS